MSILFKSGCLSSNNGINVGTQNNIGYDFKIYGQGLENSRLGDIFLGEQGVIYATNGNIVIGKL